MSNQDEIKQLARDYLTTHPPIRLVLATPDESGHIDYSYEHFVALNPAWATKPHDSESWCYWMSLSGAERLRQLDMSSDEDIPF